MGAGLVSLGRDTSMPGVVASRLMHHATQYKLLALHILCQYTCDTTFLVACELKLLSLVSNK